MFASPFKVVLDADVLYPLSLCDTLLRAAHEGFFQLHWTDEILDETFRNLVRDTRVSKEQAARRRAAMTAAFEEAMVTDYESLVPNMRNHEKDRHVAAAAVRCGAQFIVTSNVRHFENLPHGIEAQSPDDFLCDLYDLDPLRIITIMRQQSAALKRPRISFDDLLEGLTRMIPQFVANIREGRRK